MGRRSTRRQLSQPLPWGVRCALRNALDSRTVLPTERLPPRAFRVPPVCWVLCPECPMRQPAVALLLLVFSTACAAPDRRGEEDAAAAASELDAASGTAGTTPESTTADTIAHDSVATAGTAGDSARADNAHAGHTTVPNSGSRGAATGRRAATPSDTTTTTTPSGAPQMSDTTPSDTSRTTREPKPTDFRLPERRLPPPELKRPLGVPRDSTPQRDSTDPPVSLDETRAGA